MLQLLISPKGEQLKYVLQILFKASNNEAEYKALLHGLHLAISLGIKRLLVYGDSKVVIKQVNKEWDRTKENMDAYFEEERKLEKKFYGLELHHVIRDNNVGIDVLSKLGSSRAEVPAEVFVQELYRPSIKNPDELSTPSNPAPDHQVLIIDPDWTLPFIEYILHKKVPSDKAEAERVIRHSKNYLIIGDKLFRRGALSRVSMKCISSEEGKEIHSGICGSHMASHSIVGRALGLGSTGQLQSLTLKTS
jgi:ribonuclease HI